MVGQRGRYLLMDSAQIAPAGKDALFGIDFFPTLIPFGKQVWPSK